LPHTWQSRHSSATFQITWQITLGFKSIIAGLFMAWGIGADYVANSFATSVGSKALILWQAVAIATVYEFVGCISMSASVTDTVCSGFIQELLQKQPRAAAAGVGSKAPILRQAAAIATANSWAASAWVPVSQTLSVVASSSRTTSRTTQKCRSWGFRLRC
jgi:PiT family inorganic phosphate transporter